MLVMDKLTIYKTCPLCGCRTFARFRCTEKQYTDYELNYKNVKTKPIQLIFPDITKTQRETITSGLCKACQKRMF